MRPLTRLLIGALIALLLIAGHTPKLHADCKWPPLNAVEQRQSHPVAVGSVMFTTGFYSWYLEHYHIDALHCSTSISTGPRSWSATVGLGGDKPVGPRVTSKQTARQSPVARLNSLPALPSPSRVLPSLPPIAPPGGHAASPPPALPALTELPPISP